MRSVPMETNLTGVFRADRAVLPAMLSRREGHIVNVASTSGRVARGLDTAYSASKAGSPG